MKMTETEEPDFIFVQETFEYQNRPVGIVKKYRIFTAGKGKHRAAIVIPSNKIDATFITQISKEDTVYLEIIHENLKFFLVIDQRDAQMLLYVFISIYNSLHVSTQFVSPDDEHCVFETCREL